jgi:predicted dehydrogenase
VDRDFVDREVKDFVDRKEKVETFVDLRKLLEKKDIDAVVLATPNHWHALGTVWACQAGKDVYVEKPVSHSLFESRQMVKAARQYNRIVQAGTQSRSSASLRGVADYLQKGNLGEIRAARGFCYKRRLSLGKVSGPQEVPPTVDYDLWCGPAPKIPLMRKRLHYDWHWVWSTGCGEMGNVAAHQIDVCRWLLGQKTLPARAMSIGGRFGYDDDGETPNTHIAILDYQPAPIIQEVRGLPRKKGDSFMDAYRAIGRSGAVLKGGQEGEQPSQGVVIECENGWVDATKGVAYDNSGKMIRNFEGERRRTSHEMNFVEAVRSRRPQDLNCEILEGHLSTSLSHLANTSHRIGETASTGEILETIQGNHNLSEAFGRFQDHLTSNHVDLNVTHATLGPWVEFDPEQERFTGDFAERANALRSRDYREPFVVPEQV